MKQLKITQLFFFCAVIPIRSWKSAWEQKKVGPFDVPHLTQLGNKDAITIRINFRLPSVLQQSRNFLVYLDSIRPWEANR